MKTWIVLMAAGLIGGAGFSVVTAPAAPEAPANSTGKPAALRTALSDRPFFGTQAVLTLSGDYVSTPKEDYETFGVWDQPFALEQMDGVVAELAFGEAEKQGQWQLVYRRKLMNGDASAQALTDLTRGMTLADHRAQVIKASYNVRHGWRLGIAAVIEDRAGTDSAADPLLTGFRGGQAIGVQIDSSFKF